MSPLKFGPLQSELADIERDIFGKTTTDQKYPALYWLDTYTHGTYVAVDNIDKLLVCVHVCSDQAKVIRVRQSHKVSIVQVVANGFSLKLQIKKHRVEGHEEKYCTYWASLEDASFKLEGV